MAKDEEEELAFGGGEDVEQWGEGSHLDKVYPFLTQVGTLVPLMACELPWEVRIEESAILPESGAQGVLGRVCLSLELWASQNLLGESR